MHHRWVDGVALRLVKGFRVDFGRACKERWVRGADRALYATGLHIPDALHSYLHRGGAETFALDIQNLIVGRKLGASQRERERDVTQDQCKPGCCHYYSFSTKIKETLVGCATSPSRSRFFIPFSTPRRRAQCTCICTCRMR